jgi:hypothetical protein
LPGRFITSWIAAIDARISLSISQIEAISCGPSAKRVPGPAGGWHAFILMSNHYHLLVETPEPNLVTGMRWFQTTWTIRFNRRHHLSGHLLQGRYKAVVVDPEERSYFATLLQFIFDEVIQQVTNLTQFHLGKLAQSHLRLLDVVHAQMMQRIVAAFNRPARVGEL